MYQFDVKGYFMIKNLKLIIVKFVYNVLYFAEAMQYRFTGNIFVKDMLYVCGKYKNKYINFHKITEKYGAFFDFINENLYMLLNDSNDKNTFLRFLLKRFCGVNTATLEEVSLIDNAFNTVRNIYQKREGDYIEFDFRGTKIKYLMADDMRDDETKPENILMNYYDVTHAFFLTEYEMDDFNPKDGETILDCGAAYGDTLLAFRVLYPHSRIYSFERGYKTIERARKNMKLNQIENVVLMNAFLYQDSGNHILNMDTGKIDDEKYGSNQHEIETLAIDDFICENNIEDIGLIKFDIEGGEIPALNGSIETIKAFKPLLYVPIYHLDSDIYTIPSFLKELNIPMKLRIKWTEKKVWGVDCVLFVKFY